MAEEAMETLRGISDLTTLKVTELRVHLKAFGLGAGGRKADMISRIQEYMAVHGGKGEDQKVEEANSAPAEAPGVASGGEADSSNQQKEVEPKESKEEVPSPVTDTQNEDIQQNLKEERSKLATSQKATTSDDDKEDEKKAPDDVQDRKPETGSAEVKSAEEPGKEPKEDASFPEEPQEKALKKRGRDKVEEEEETVAETQREVSPSKFRIPKKKKTTLRRKESKYWDVPPEGFDTITAQQYKQMVADGQLPAIGIGAVGQAQSSQVRSGAGGKDGGHGPGGRGMGSKRQSMASDGNPSTRQSSVEPQEERQARRLYVGSLPHNITEQELIMFLNTHMEKHNLTTQPGGPAIAAQINRDKGYSFVEFREAPEATYAMALDGIQLRGHGLKIRRPKDYVWKPEHGNPKQIQVKGVISTQVMDGPEKLFIGGLPTAWTAEEVKELLQQFGPLRGFTLMSDPNSGFSKGYCFAEFAEKGVTDMAIWGMNGIDLGERQLVVQRASVGRQSDRKVGPPVMLPLDLEVIRAYVEGRPLPTSSSGHGPGPEDVSSKAASSPTEVLVLMNMVQEDELRDQEEYEDIVEDIREECGRYGQVIDVVIPKPSDDGTHVPGMGKVFVHFGRVEDSIAAEQALSGRTFNDRQVMTAFLALDALRNRDFD
eukprot:Clim_evm13s197 gene=Clim_evmTU13s197